MGLEDGASASAAREPSPSPAELLIARLRVLVAVRDRPLFVGIDGRSGAGKSTLAATISMGSPTQATVPVSSP